MMITEKVKSIFSKLFNKKTEVPASLKAERFFPDPDMGLSSEQVETRISESLVNAVPDKTSKSTAQIIFSNIFTYFNMLFLVVAVILISVGTSINNLTFMVIVIINTVIGIVQELRAKKTLEKLTLVSAPLTKTIRDGNVEMVNSDELVLDDIAVFSAGNQIPADAVICDGEVNVNEALVTGESDEIKKIKGMQLLSGSFIVSGECRARLDKIGSESFAAKLASDAKKIKKKQKPGMMKSLTLLIKIIGVIIIPLAILTFLNQSVRLGHGVKESVESTAASVTGMIPDGLYLLASIALAVSVMRLAKKKTLVHDMKCIETLARVDVICVDKTGTVTEPEMHLQDIISIDEYTDETTLCGQVRDLVMNMSSDSITMTALKEYFDDKRPFRKAAKVKAFSSATKFSAVSYGGSTAYLLGAPEFIMREEFDGIREAVEEQSAMGKRVLLFAECTFDDDGDVFGGRQLSGNVIPIGLVTLKNRVRAEAKETFDYFTQQGVEIKVISGDNPITVSKAAEEAGIPGYDKYIDATTLTTKEKIAKAVTEYTVFGRVTPDQKRMFVKALKKSGHTVAMTGDGVNDVLALKDADCSIAMASGSDAAANVSDLVLLDSNFASMPSVVAEGRRVINNIERSASLFLMKNIFTFFLTIIALISQSLYPFYPAQLTLISALMIGCPSFFLALEENTDLVRGKFLKNVLFRAFPGAITAVILVSWSLLFSAAFEFTRPISSTTAFYIYSFVAYLMLLRVCKPMNLLHRVLFGGMGILFVLAVTIIPQWFMVSPLDFKSLLVLSVLIALAYPINKLLFNMFNDFGSFRKKAEEYVANDIEKHKNDAKDCI